MLGSYSKSIIELEAYIAVNIVFQHCLKKPETEYSLASKTHQYFICPLMLLLYFQYLEHTGPFIISKLPACVDPTNRSVGLGSFLILQMYRKLCIELAYIN